MDIDTQEDWETLLNMLPEDLYGADQDWTNLRNSLYLAGLQGDIIEAEFDYLPLSDVLTMTASEIYERGTSSQWLYVGTDDEPQDGFTTTFDTTGLNEWCVIRVYLIDSTFANSRFGFGLVNVLDDGD